MDAEQAWQSVLGQLNIHTIGNIGNIQIAVTQEPSVEHGRQLILVSDNDAGHLLVESLFPGQRLTWPALDGNGNGWIRVPHNADVDHTLIRLVDVAAEIRRQAPRLVQLTLTGLDAEALAVTLFSTDTPPAAQGEPEGGERGNDGHR